ncbi:MAG: ketoacyl-ACP synthase III [Bacteroidota bacterium]
MKYTRSRIIGTGAHIPSRIIQNHTFESAHFVNADGSPMKYEAARVVEKFGAVAGILERRYAKQDVLATDLAVKASQRAIEAAKIDPESIDYIILAHNFGDVRDDGGTSDVLPNLAARVKHHLGIKNSFCVAYDLLFGCPGWVQGLIQADYFLRSGDAKRALVIGADTLSRVVDKHDRDRMLFSDGAGAVILEAVETDEDIGIISHVTVSDCQDEVDYLRMDQSFLPEEDPDGFYMKMDGRNVFRYAMEKVPPAISHCLEKAGQQLEQVSSFLLHQANVKMIRMIIARLFDNHKVEVDLDQVLPITADVLGNSSVATIPTLLDLMARGEMEGHVFKKDELIVFASVGAGMHANCLLYRHG